MERLDLRGSPDLSITRPPVASEPIETVRNIIEDVRTRGDRALREMTLRFDGVAVEELRVPGGVIDASLRETPAPIREALELAAANIRRFATAQLVHPWSETIDGATVGEAVTPVGRAGAYVPGGRATYPSTVLMSAIPASVAGVVELALCVPPGPDGEVPSVTLAAAAIAGVSEVYRVGGAQAIAAMAFGTESIPKVDVIVGPGNIYVALAKREVSGYVGIDSVAGPSEIAIVADGTADPTAIAYDLIAQAEHGPDGSFVLVTWDEALASAVDGALNRSFTEIGAGDALRTALERGSVVALVQDLSQAITVVDRFAPEHLELIFDGAQDAAGSFRNAGAIFVGPYSP
ncbi:MAG TPA: histidinol dehydrogenase, partial [Actinomycetota bacterium]|nr:histidinol dehydrogenase [Actinomycetota bacterium]